MFATRNFFLGTFVLALFAVLFLGLRSPTVAQNPEVDNETCLDCHEEYDRSLAPTPHRLNQESSLQNEQIGCTSCHKGASVHIDDPDIDNISNPSNLLGNEILEVCTQCHSAHAELDNYGFDAHSIQELSCADCHKVHGYSASLLLDDYAQFCFRCHEGTKTQFAKNSNHPALQKNITCLDCHRFTKRNDHDLAYDLNRTCQDCHPEQGGPFL